MTREPETQAPAKRRTLVAPLVVGAGALGAVALATPALTMLHGTTVCPFKLLTGLDCPGCGMMRACSSLAHGNLVGAADHNLLLVAALPFLVFWWVLWVRASRAGRLAPVPSSRVIWVIVAITVIFTVVRNIPGVPFLNAA